MEFDQALQTFIMESRELLEAMEESLLGLESSPDDPDSPDNRDAIGAIFRSAHTIKGSGGLFGLDGIVAFTHVVENVLDRVRGGEVPVDGDLVALLLSCRDHIGMLVEQIAVDAAAQPDKETEATGIMLLNQLKAYQAGAKGTAPAVTGARVQSQAPVITTLPSGGTVESDNWHISLRFSHDVLRNGMDPLAFIRYLDNMGKIVHVVTLPDAMPLVPDMDPESCYLGFEIDFHGDNVGKATIEGVFEFVRDDCTLRILPPHSRIEEYIQLINELSEDKIRLGDLLVNSGSLTRKELDEALCLQALSAESCREKSPTQDICQLGEILVKQGMVQPELVDAALGKQKVAKENKVQESKLIRIQADKLDQLINLVGEMVIAGAATSLLAQRTRDPALHEATSTLSRLVEEIRDSALQLRMVQIGETFSRFNRVVRDVSKEIGKEIGLSIGGAETELDKSVVEKIGDPLMHLVRNSMDHGIEKAEIRRQRGKPAKGTVHLNAYHESGSIVVEVGDDGGGLNRDRILAKALEKGLVTANQTLSDQDVYGLIFEAGFSTAEAVTNLSGRGVGMDVVRRNIEALRGTVEIDSREGAGATVRIRLPLTLAIIDGFLLGVGSASYVVPLDMVMECIELDDAERQETRESNYINLRGTVLPFIRLRDQFRELGKAGRRENIVVVQYAGQKAGLVVDELMGEFQTVIKPLGKLFGNLKGVSGSTILGSGEVALILDVPALIQRAVSKEAQLLAYGL
ncbi:MAG: chemotaxis protein CheA [Nitrosomonadales bacterium]|nr:chemotaxis protein CheA [Nitrosomonadales bacterium]